MMHSTRQFDTAFCRWECPLCGATSLSIRSDTDCQSACNNLRTHIRATSDELHGGQGEYPTMIDPEELSEYVTCDENHSPR